MSEEQPHPPTQDPSAPLNELYNALATAQGEFPVIPKDQEVEVKKDGRLLYKFKYADLTTIISATRPALAKNGISFTQSYDKATGVFYTRFMHKSGVFIDTGLIPCAFPNNADMKTIAGLVTYVKRISLTAALGVSADEDVDAAHDESSAGNTSSKGPSPFPDEWDNSPPPGAKAKAAPKAKAPPTKAPPKNHAPGAKSPAPQADRSLESIAADLEGQISKWKFPVGQYTGKTLLDLGYENAKKYANWVLDSQTQTGQPPMAYMQEAVDHFEMFQKLMEVRELIEIEKTKP